jgi:hypothetical protein
LGNDEERGVSEAIGPLAKVKVMAAEAVKPLSLKPEAMALLQPQASVPEFLSALIAAGLMNDAVAVMAQALPKREAVWWACLAARTLVDAETAPPVIAAIEAAEAWVYKPTEELRRAAMERAQATGFDHPGVWAAVGAFWSGGSMAPPNVPAVPPAEHLTGLAVSGAVNLAAVIRQPEQAPAKLKAFMEQAVDIANGGSGRLKAAS